MSPARRAMQVAAAKWLAKWSYRLQGIFALLGFFIVLLPVFNKSWRGIIESCSLTAWIFHEFSTLKGFALLWLGFLLLLFFILNFNHKNLPGGWDITKEGGFPNPQQVFELGLYPRNSKEEFVFWIDFVLGTIGTTIVLYLPFGVMAYLMRIGN
jgi:hypothetical protein